MLSTGLPDPVRIDTSDQRYDSCEMPGGQCWDERPRNGNYDRRAIGQSESQ